MAAANAYAPVTNADPSWVGNTFVSKFYDMLAKHPGFLHGFYKDVSTFTIADMQNGESAPRSASDTKSIQDLVSRTIAGARATVKHFDAQFSVQGGVLLHVVGTLLIQGQERPFNQTFFLATQENGFYVHNDMLRVYPATSVPLSNGDHKEPPAALPRAVPAPTAQPPAAAPPQKAAPAPAQKPPRSQAASPAPPPAAPTPPPAATPQQAPSPGPTARPPSAQAEAAPAQPSPSPASSWAALVKHPQTAAPTKTPPSTPAPAPTPANVDSQPAPQPQANGNIPHAAHGRSQSTDSGAAARPGTTYTSGPVHSHTVVIRNLPNEHLAMELFEEVFAQFGPLRKGPGAVTIHNMGREHGKLAYIKYEDASGVEAAVKATGVKILDRVVEVAKFDGPLPNYQTRGGPGRGGFRGGRTGMGGPPGRGTYDGGRGMGRGGMGGDRQPRPDRRPPSGNASGPGSGTGPATGGQGGPSSGNNTRSGSAHGSRGRGGGRKEDSAEAPAAKA